MVFEVVKQQKIIRNYETRRESWEMRAQHCGERSKDKQWKLLKWCLSFVLLQWVPHQLEIIDSKSRLAGRLSEPRSWRTGGLRPLGCICKCATAAFPAQDRKQQPLGCKTHLFGFFAGDKLVQRAPFVKSRTETARAELWNSGFYTTQHQKQEKQRLLQHGMRL